MIRPAAPGASATSVLDPYYYAEIDPRTGDVTRTAYLGAGFLFDTLQTVGSIAPGGVVYQAPPPGSCGSPRSEREGRHRPCETAEMPSPTQRALARVPVRLRPFLVRHRRLVKFLLVGGLCFVLTLVVDVQLKATVLEHKPVVALTVATVIGTAVSYVLNRCWSFRADGHRREALLFLLVSAVAIAVNDVPLVVSRYVLDLREPFVGPVAQEAADFLSGMVLGTFVAMLFRYWAMRRWVFTRPAARPAAGPAAAPTAGSALLRTPPPEPGYAATEVPRGMPPDMP
ncbi:GtrA family protein [Kitasatospora sp. NPDC051705]|uniref:GtrA family protein n=1 Tax=Kitasatospora sp. NPDC051705 TaxID=3364057 RepID=UPI0037ACD534